MGCHSSRSNIWQFTPELIHVFDFLWRPDVDTPFSRQTSRNAGFFWVRGLAIATVLRVATVLRTKTKTKLEPTTTVRGKFFQYFFQCDGSTAARTRFTAGGVPLDDSSAGGGWDLLDDSPVLSLSPLLSLSLDDSTGGAETLFLFAHWVLFGLHVCNEHVGWHSCKSKRLGRAIRRAPRRYCS